MQQDDLNFWKWILGGFVALISGVVSGTWATASKTKDYEAKLQAHAKKFENLSTSIMTC